MHLNFQALEIIDAEIDQQLALRRKQSLGSSMYDASGFAQGPMSILPETLQPKPGRVSLSQQRVYEVQICWPLPKIYIFFVVGYLNVTDFFMIHRILFVFLGKLSKLLRPQMFYLITLLLLVPASLAHSVRLQDSLTEEFILLALGLVQLPSLWVLPLIKLIHLCHKISGAVSSTHLEIFFQW